VRYRFGNHELDASTFTLNCSGRLVALQPKVFDVLHYLIAHRERVVSKEELLEAVWRAEYVSEAAVPWSVSHARAALGQRRGSKSPIETAHGRGYRFVAEVEELETAPSPPTPAPAVASAIVAAASIAGPPFVGREDAMRRLIAQLDEARAGSGRFCLLSGEAGIGKTRCSEEFLTYAARTGCRVWAGRSFEDAGEPVFWPFMQIVREAVRALPELREAGEPLLERLAALDGGDPGDEASTERDEIPPRFWPLDEVTRLLLRAAQSVPVVLLLDDLQWADAGTLNLLNFLTMELGSSRMLVIATQREELTAGSSRRLARLGRHAERIDLTRLSQADVAHYIAAMTQAGPAETVARAVHRATAGNPLFVQETVRGLIAEHGTNALQSLSESAIVLPEVARDVLRAPLQALDPDARALLGCASVLGERFELSLLQALTDLSLSRLLALIESAARQRLIVAEAPTRYRFAHALIRTLLYDEMPTAERVALHRKAAEELEAQNSLEPRYHEIAHHFYRSLPAGAYDRVAAAARRAAVAAEAVYGYEDAVRMYGWALEAQALDPGASPRARAELLFACGYAQRKAGSDADARRTLVRLLELARQHDYADLLVVGVRVLRPTFAMSGVPDTRVRDALEAALRIAPAGANPVRISAMSQLACVPPYANDMQRSKQLSAEALGLARECAEAGPLFEALRARLYSLSGPDDIDALLAVVDEMLQRDQARGNAFIVEAYSARLGALAYRGDAEIDHTIELIGRTVRDLRLAEGTWLYERQRAQRMIARGDFAAAHIACDELLARSKRIRLSYGEMFVANMRTLLMIEERGLSAAAKTWAGFNVASDGPNLQPHMRARLVRVGADIGRRASAKAGLDVLAAQGFDTIPKDICYLNTLANIGLAAIALGDRERAGQVYALLAPYARFNTPDQLYNDMGSVSRYLALLADHLGHDAHVEAHFEQAMAMNRRMNRGPQLARTCFEYASWLARKRSNARGRAHELSREARAIAESFGMKWLVETANTLTA
jgi:DNA-binding winged helix-turn-helix (wHTH) protein